MSLHAKFVPPRRIPFSVILILTSILNVPLNSIFTFISTSILFFFLYTLAYKKKLKLKTKIEIVYQMGP